MPRNPARPIPSKKYRRLRNILRPAQPPPRMNTLKQSMRRRTIRAVSREQRLKHVRLREARVDAVDVDLVLCVLECDCLVLRVSEEFGERSRNQETHLRHLQNRPLRRGIAGGARHADKTEDGGDIDDPASVAT